MSLRRWAATTAAMAAVAWALVLLGPHPAQAWRAVTGPQALVDVAGVDALLVPVAAAAGWAGWASGCAFASACALSARASAWPLSAASSPAIAVRILWASPLALAASSALDASRTARSR